jgi:hypothetical protein
MDADTLDLLRTSLAHVLTTEDATPFGARLDDLGWADVVADDPAAALQTLFDVKGATLSAAAALDDVLTSQAAEITGCDTIRGGAVALGADLRAARLERGTGSTLPIDVIVLSPGVADPTLLVAATDGDTLRLALVGDAGLTVSSIEGMDPSLGLVHVTGTADPTWIDADGPSVLRELTALAQRALAAELVGLAQVMLAGAVQYACDRRQYGRAIGSFQAVQHRLADARAAVTGAAVVAEEAFVDDSAWTSTVAKALAGRGFEEASRQCQQVYGAIGFTWEHEFHRFLRRGYMLDALYGDWRSLQEEIGRALGTTRTVPRIGSL